MIASAAKGGGTKMPLALAPVAITASILAILGFEPVTAAVLALLANTAPVAFGSIGIPIVTLGGLVAPILHKDVTSTTLALSAMVGRQLPIFSVLIPGYLIVILAGPATNAVRDRKQAGR